jgi:hypothetical protein
MSLNFWPSDVLCLLWVPSAPHFWLNSPTRARGASFWRFLEYTQWHTTVGTAPLGEWSDYRKNLHLTTHKQQTDRHVPPPPQGFFFFSCTLYLVRTWFFVLIFEHFVFCLYLQHTAQTSMPPGGNRTLNPSKPIAADPRLRPLGHCELEAKCFHISKH